MLDNNELIRSSLEADNGFKRKLSLVYKDFFSTERQ